MDPSYRLPNLQEIIQEMEKEGIYPTPQAAATFFELIHRSHPSIVGDTDTLLAGLLLSGSYTVDILETAGVNPKALRARALESIASFIPLGDTYPFELSDISGRGGEMLSHIASNKGTLETSDILEAAIAPRSDHRRYGDDREYRFPREDRKDCPPSSTLLHELETRVEELLTFIVKAINLDRADEVIRTRTSAITDAEYELIREDLEHADLPSQSDESEFAISAMNNWFLHRRILTDPPDICLRTVNEFSPLLIAPEFFLAAGGNIKSVDVALQMAAKYSPEHDLPTVALFMRDGHIQVGQYTYRNSFIVDSGSSTGSRIQRVQLQAIRPVPILSHLVLGEFERLIALDALKESDIQQFLTRYPEMLSSLGYVSAYPHICLRTEDSERFVPDFILEIPGGLGFDILDLKQPAARLTARNPYLRVSSELMKAVAQLRKYARYFENAANRKEFEKKFGLVAFKPELIVVMGRSSEFETRDDRMEIAGQLGYVKLITYDDLIAYGRSRSIVIP